MENASRAHQVPTVARGDHQGVRQPVPNDFWNLTEEGLPAKRSEAKTPLPILVEYEAHRPMTQTALAIEEDHLGIGWHVTEG